MRSGMKIPANPWTDCPAPASPGGGLPGARFLGRNLWALGIVFLGVGIAVLSVSGVDSVSLNVDSLALNHWWTLWTGHFLHFTAAHAFWDWTVFFVCLWMLRRGGIHLVLAVLAMLPLLSIGLFLWRPDLWEYRGLSGIDTVLYVRIAVGFLAGERGSTPLARILGGVLPLLGLIAKILYEFLRGGTLFSGDLGAGNEAVPEVHLIGLALGVIWGGFSVRSLRFHKTRQASLPVSRSIRISSAFRSSPQR